MRELVDRPDALQRNRNSGCLCDPGISRGIVGEANHKETYAERGLQNATPLSIHLRSDKGTRRSGKADRFRTQSLANRGISGAARKIAITRRLKEKSLTFTL